ncbi:MAG: hypothetical protein P1U65_01850 [Minwuia sp.]|nr:hypothetical protein [Minwuia sp.]
MMPATYVRQDRKLVRRCACAALGLALAGTVNAQESLEIGHSADPLPEWRVDGTNTFRAEQSGVAGDASANPNPDNAFNFFDDVHLNLERRYSPWNFLRGSFDGVINSSEFRSAQRGIVPERANLTWTKGDGRVPLRAEFGDFFGFYSFRTLQRALKGGQVELQPQIGWLDGAHSLQFSSGANQQTYVGSAFDNWFDDYFNGASWLTEDGGSTWSASLVHGFRQADGATPERNQVTGSVAGVHERRVGSQILSLEGEVALLNGDIGNGGAGETGALDYSMLAEISGRSEGSSLTYSFRFDQTGAEFRPNGGVVAADRRTFDLRGGYRLDNGLALRGRLQQFTDSFTRANSTDTQVAGLTIAGPIRLTDSRSVSMTWDSFLQGVANDNNTTETLTGSSRLGLSAAIASGWTGRANLFYQQVENSVADTLATTREVALSATHGIEFAGFRGSVAPGVLWRLITGAGNDETDVGATLAANLFRGGHTLGANYRLLLQDQEGTNNVETLAQTLSTSYAYRSGPHTFGSSIDLFHRQPEPGGFTSAYRVGVFYTLAFQKATAADRQERAAAVSPSLVPIVDGDFPGELDLIDLTPRMALAEARGRLAAAGITGGVEEPGAVVYQSAYLPQIANPQRLALLHDGNRLVKAAAIFDLVATGDPIGAQQVFQDIQRLMIQRYGTPAVFERGEFGADFVDRINANSLIRVSEWRTPDGVLRLGIPRRTDGTVRIELQYAARFPPPGQTRWSVEQVF